MSKKKKPKELVHKLPFPNLRIDCYGRGTYVYLDGMEITSGVLALNYKAAGMSKNEPPVLELKLHPHAVRLRRVTKEKIETARSTESYFLHKIKAQKTVMS